MHIIWILIIGFVVGALAKLLMPGKDTGGAVVTVLVGVAGSMLAYLVGRASGWYASHDSAGFIASVIGAVVLLGAYRSILGYRAHRSV